MKRPLWWTMVLVLAALPTAAPVGVTFLIRGSARYQLSKQTPDIDADVLIIYTVGIPFKTLTEVRPSEADAVTNPTPVFYNTRVIADDLGALLMERGHRVRVAEASQVDGKDVLRHRVLVLGTPTHYWNVDWQMKRFLDERMTPIYVAHKQEFRGWPVAGFAMAEIQPSAEQALDKLQSVLKDCGTDLAIRQVFLTGDDEDQYTKTLHRFAAEIASLSRGAGR